LSFDSKAAEAGRQGGGGKCGVGGRHGRDTAEPQPTVKPTPRPSRRRSEPAASA
jgi:hypothetical protein